MKRIVYFNGKKIVDISTMELPSGYGNRINHNAKVYIFEDNTYIKASETNGKKFTYVCDECGVEIESTTKPEYNKDCPYICNKCRGLNHNGFKGKKHTQELKDKLSSDRKGTWCVGENNPMYGKNWKDYTTQDVIDLHNKRLSESFSGEKNPMYGKNIKDYMTADAYELWKKHVKENGYHSKSKEEQKILSKKMSDGQRALRDSNPEYYREIKARGGIASVLNQSRYYKMSSIEVIIDNFLKENNIDYEYSVILGRFQYDFLIHNKRILIEVNGDYWHANPNMFDVYGYDGKRKINDIQRYKIERDKEKYEFAISHNFEIIYIWEEEIKKGDFTKLEKILC